MDCDTLPGNLTNFCDVVGQESDPNLLDNTQTITTGVTNVSILLTNSPTWWTNRNVITGAAAEDFAAVNQGQLKHIANEAFNELEAEIPCWAGTNLAAIVGSFSSGSNDFAVANIGQLKYVGQAFYDRLAAFGFTNGVPWTVVTTDDVDFGAANIGQVKAVFNFEISQP